MLKILFCVFLFHIKIISGDNILEKNQNESSFNNLLSCLLNIKEVLAQPIIYTGNKTESLENNEVFDLIVKLQNNGIPHFTTNYVQAFKRAVTTENAVIIFIEDCDELSILSDVILDNFKYLIILLEQIECEYIDKVGADLSRKDVTFIVKRSEADYAFISYIPGIDDATCEYIKNVPSKVINLCTKGFLIVDTVFPDKNPLDIKRCPLRVGTASNYPFAKANTTKMNMNPIEEVSGSDVELVKIISQYFNATLQWYYILQEQDNPFMHTEFIYYLQNGSLDLCVGGLYRLYGDIVAYSGIYNRQAVTWMYHVERGSRSWQALVKNINGLYIFLSFYIAHSISWFVVSKFDSSSYSLSNTLVYSWGALMGGSSLQDGRTRKQKILNISYLYMCIHLSAYISVQMFSFLTIQGPPQMFKSNDDIMKSGRIPYLRPESKYFVEDQKYVAFASTSKDCNSFHDCELRVLENNGLTVIVDGYFVPFQMITSVNDEARIMKASENLLTIYHEMILRKNSPIVKRIQKIVKKLFEAGICDRLVVEAMGLTLVDKAEIAAKNIMGNSYSCKEGCSITLSQSAGGFYVWAIGCSLSCVVFVIEIFLKRDSKEVIVC